MTGFSADWLSLREPADGRARNREVLAAVAVALRDVEAPRIVDLACGTGSTLRALAPHLPMPQRWRLVDNDEALLQRAREESAGDIETVAADLSGDPDPVLESADLVVTSAFLDLVSGPWLARLVSALAARKLPFYAALTYDGRASCEPAHPLDEAVTEAVNAHQRGDKGFGPALGPAAARQAETMLEDAGFAIVRGLSDWTCAPDEPIFQGELVSGWASAAREIAGLSDAEIDDWLAFRRKAIADGSSRILVGHVDLYATPA